MVMAALCARFALGAVFIVSGILKLGDRASFTASIRAMGIADPRHAAILAVVVPIAEICSGAAMAVGLLTTAAAAVIGALTLAFTFLLVAQLARGREVVCNCFGSASRHVVTWFSVLRNTAVLAAAVLVYGWAEPVLAVDGIRHRPATALTGSDAVAALVLTTSGMLAALVGHRLLRLSRVAR